jgi:hypothetical protein
MGQSENIADPSDRLILRTLLNGTGDGDSLQNVNTTPLPQGCLAWADDVKALKTSSASAQPEQIVVPGSGPGRWFRLVSSDTLASGVLLESFANNAYATDGNFHASTDNSFATAGPAAPSWALTAMGGILTYSGPERTFSVTLLGQVQVGDVTAPRQVFAAVSQNDDTAGTAQAGNGTLGTTCAIVNVPYAIGVSRRVILATGDTLRPKFGVASGATSLAAELTMIVTPA